MSHPYQAPGGLPREFRMADGGFGRMVVPFVFMLVFFAVIMLLLGSMFLGGIVGGICVAVVSTGALTAVLYVKFAKMKAGTLVRFSEAIGEQNGVQVSVGAMKSQGIIGWGERVIPHNAPDWMRANLAAQPKNPYDGRPEVAIPLGGVDPNWQHGPMGQWLRQYRPDLMGGGYPPPGYPQPGYPPQQSYPPNQPYPPR